MTEVIFFTVLFVVLGAAMFVRWRWLLNIDCERAHNWKSVQWEDCELQVEAKYVSGPIKVLGQKRACRDCGLTQTRTI